MPYQISSRAYLQRARYQLDQGTPEALFYAAFELRCGIESRMQQYLDAQDHVAKHRKKDWKLSNLSQSVEEAFHLGDKILKATIRDALTGETIEILYYTPITSDLRRDGELLGDLLHALQKLRLEDDPWWSSRREFLEGVYRKLELANVGTLLGPLLQKGDTSEAIMRAELIDPTHEERMKEVLYPGFFGILKLEYLDHLPSITDPSLSR